MKDLLHEIDTGEFDMDLSGFDDLDLKNLFAELDEFEPEEEPEKEKEPRKCICPDCGKEFYV